MERGLPVYLLAISAGASRHLASIPLAENRGNQRRHPMHDRRAVRRGDSFLHLRLAADHHDAIGRTRDRLAIADPEHRVVFFVTDHREHVKAVCRQIRAGHGREGVDRVALHTRGLWIDQLLLREIGNELMAAFIAGERRVERGGVTGDRQRSGAESKQHGQKKAFHKRGRRPDSM
ncbi:hypothetical protein Bxe_B0623 [Paraburkholderia xenovorans LB400]|uniref:Uncharacterized protein n=1 Tax=Paraburkholderia xenovorans (strain LB400) TaxID=266265 RepID=Q13KR1_PARXL|nr:hypothetical protein Bxe_B0623 [Paraburkholderia xenovorans LB400]